MRITSKGQVTIQADIRDRAGLLPNTEVDFEFDGEVVRLHAAVSGYRFLTRDAGRYRTYFPKLELIAPA